MVEFSSLDGADLSGYKAPRPLGVHGTLGLINIDQDVFLCVITASYPAATVRPGETVERIVSVEFYCLNRADYDEDPYGGSIGRSDWSGGYVKGFENQAADQREGAPEHPCLALQKLLSSGTFYYSVDFDLTNRLQNR
jgi:hypothetical protein